MNEWMKLLLSLLFITASSILENTLNSRVFAKVYTTLLCLCFAFLLFSRFIEQNMTKHAVVHTGSDWCAHDLQVYFRGVTWPQQPDAVDVDAAISGSGEVHVGTNWLPVTVAGERPWRTTAVWENNTVELMQYVSVKWMRPNRAVELSRG